MRRLIVLISLFVAAPAQAAPLSEVPFRPLPDNRNAICLRATGVPGGLAMYRPRATDLLDGTTPAARLRLGRLVACAATATAGDAAVLAAPVLGAGDRVRVRAAVRDPGGAFAAPVPLGAADDERPSVGAPAVLSGPLRDVNGVAPLLLADGRAAVAWTDNATSFALPVGQGRLHLAVESAPALPELPRPRVTVTAARTQRLYDPEPVRLRVHCDRACDVRAALPVPSEPPDVEAHSLRRAGTLSLALSRLDIRRGKVERQRLRIHVRAGAPNAREVASVSRRVLVVRRPPLPVPRLLDVRAVRRGPTSASGCGPSIRRRSAGSASTPSASTARAATARSSACASGGRCRA